MSTSANPHGIAFGDTLAGPDGKMWRIVAATHRPGESNYRVVQVLTEHEFVSDYWADRTGHAPEFLDRLTLTRLGDDCMIFPGQMPTTI
jgi:hypothetical protein